MAPRVTWASASPFSARSSRALSWPTTAGASKSAIAVSVFTACTPRSISAGFYNPDLIIPERGEGGEGGEGERARAIALPRTEAHRDIHSLPCTMIPEGAGQLGRGVDV